MAHLTEMILATGALGTAAFGVVEGLKWTSWLGEAGFSAIPKTLGSPLTATIERAYGKDYERLLRAQYRESNGDSKGLTKRQNTWGQTLKTEYRLNDKTFQKETEKWFPIFSV